MEGVEWGNLELFSCPLPGLKMVKHWTLSFPASKGSLVCDSWRENREPLPIQDGFSYRAYSSVSKQLVCIWSQRSQYPTVRIPFLAWLFPVKPDVNWFCSSTVVDGGISNKASGIGRGSLFSRQESQTREPLLAVKHCTSKITTSLYKNYGHYVRHGFHHYFKLWSYLPWMNFFLPRRNTF